jgi:hypothetical protein
VAISREALIGSHLLTFCGLTGLSIYDCCSRAKAANLAGVAHADRAHPYQVSASLRARSRCGPRPAGMISPELRGAVPQHVFGLPALFRGSL